MRILFYILLLLHASIHLLGFLKAFELMEVKALGMPISKNLGLVWLVGMFLFIIYGIFYYFNHQFSWVIGTLAIVVSQFLIIFFWKEAKYGTVMNIVFLFPVLFSFGSFQFNKMVNEEKEELFIVQDKHNEKEILSEEELNHLPAPVRRWILQSGAVGKQKLWNGKISQKAKMKMKPDQEDWFYAKATQYTFINTPAFLWTVEMDMNAIMWVKGRDKFENGKGQMLIRMNGLFNIVDESGLKIDEGSLQRFLGEMVWFPSMALSPYVSWESIDEYTAQAKMNYNGTEGTGKFYFNEKGDFVKFTALRFQGNEPDSKRRKWILTVDDYGVFEGIKIPTKMKSTWRLENGDWTWLELEIKDIDYNI